MTRYAELTSGDIAVREALAKRLRDESAKWAASGYEAAFLPFDLIHQIAAVLSASTAGEEQVVDVALAAYQPAPEEGEVERLNRKLDEADKIIDRLQSQKADAEGALEDYIKHCRCNDP